MIHDIYTGTAVTEIDQLAIERHGFDAFELMTLAGEKVWQRISRRFSSGTAMLVLCGSGNNGGDGYIVAAAALEAGWAVDIVASSTAKSSSSKMAMKRCAVAGGEIIQARDWLQQDVEPARYDVVVDALLGVGISGAPSGAIAKLLGIANTLLGYKVSIDVPSGVNADTGAVLGACFKADETLTFIARKFGLLTGAAKNYVGSVYLETLGIPEAVVSGVAACAKLLTPPELRERQPDSHKGRFGHVMICGGDDGMLGAVLLAGRAALRCGTGKVHILSTSKHLDWPALSTPELMSAEFDNQGMEMAQKADALAVGPGLGLAPWGERLFEQIIALDKAMVIDADALTLLAKTRLQAHQANWVLTPHPGEAARLLSVSPGEIQQNRRAAVIEIAQRYQAVCVLKGAGTLIATPQGELSVCDRGNAGMATAGMGDVLTGMIAAYLGFGYSSDDAAKAAVYTHSMTADRCCESQRPASLIATDIIDALKYLVD